MTKYIYNPSYVGDKSLPEKDLCSGLSSSVSWENPSLWNSLYACFDIKPHEVLKGIRVDEWGICARIDIK